MQHILLFSRDLELANQIIDTHLRDIYKDQYIVFQDENNNIILGVKNYSDEYTMGIKNNLGEYTMGVKNNSDEYVMNIIYDYSVHAKIIIKIKLIPNEVLLLTKCGVLFSCKLNEGVCLFRNLYTCQEPVLTNIRNFFFNTNGTIILSTDDYVHDYTNNKSNGYLTMMSENAIIKEIYVFACHYILPI